MRTTKEVIEVRLEDGTIVDLVASKSGVGIIAYAAHVFYFDTNITKRDAKELAEALLELVNDES